MSIICEKCHSRHVTSMASIEDVYYECLDCGHQFELEPEDDEMFAFDASDRFADAEALASAGFGTDEDYGGENWMDD